MVIGKDHISFTVRGAPPPAPCACYWKVMISSNSLSGNLIVVERSPVRIRYLGWPVLR